MNVLLSPSTHLEAMENETLMQTLTRYQISVNNVCNGKGTCGKCKVRFISTAPPANESELGSLTEREITMGVRLACTTTSVEGMIFEIYQQQVVYDRKEAALRGFTATEINPGVRKVFLEVPLASVADERGDWERVLEALGMTPAECKPAYSVLQKLPRVIREGGQNITLTLWQATAINVESGDTTQSLLGLAVDIGTTSVAIALVDLKNGQILSVASLENAQTSFGADVISRISYAKEDAGQAEKLKIAVRETINQLISKTAEKLEISPSNIYAMTVVGNTTMHHLLLGLDVSYLAESPFVSVGNSGMEFTAKELGIAIHPEGRILTLPNIAGYVGGDTVGAILGSSEAVGPGNHLLIDIGTNCELYLKGPKVMLACSTAAGPAFEGAGITNGMRAKPGAIEGVKVSDGGVDVEVIGNGPAIGICGSGLIQGIDEMRRAGVLNLQGKIQDPVEAKLTENLRNRVRQGFKGREFVLSFGQEGIDVALNQKDISELQLAKGAVCAGIKTLLDLAGITMDELDSVILAGTFATYLDIDSVLNIGLIPEVDKGKIRAVGNAAQVGALKALLDHRVVEEAQQLVHRIQHVELASSMAFSNYFMSSMYLGRM